MRKSSFERDTKETSIAMTLNLDGSGNCDANTSIPFMDHMLNLFAFHGLFDLKVKAKGDTEIDYHHLMEDLGITFGELIKKSLGEKKGIRRYGHACIPMDESLAEVTLDLSGRPYLVYRVNPAKGNLRELESSLFEDFFRSLSNHAMMNLHINVRYGRDLHHIFEAVFKAFAKALMNAVSVDPRMNKLPTTKGKL